MNQSPHIRIPFSGVGYRYGIEETESVIRAMNEANTFTQGAYQRQFEHTFAQFIDMPHAFATSSCAAAIELAAILFGVKAGDEVICPAHTYCASIYPFARHGIKVRWADIDSETFLVNADTIRPLINPRTKVIIVVHLYGLPADMRNIMSMAHEHGILVLEDCAQSIGASIEGKMAGSFGDISVFSFQSHKNISTLGEGGMICLRDENWAGLVPGSASQRTSAVARSA